MISNQDVLLNENKIVYFDSLMPIKINQDTGYVICEFALTLGEKEQLHSCKIVCLYTILHMYQTYHVLNMIHYTKCLCYS